MPGDVAWQTTEPLRPMSRLDGLAEAAGASTSADRPAAIVLNDATRAMTARGRADPPDWAVRTEAIMDFPFKDGHCTTYTVTGKHVDNQCENGQLLGHWL